MKTIINIIILGFIGLITWDYAQLGQDKNIQIYPPKITQLKTPVDLKPQLPKTPKASKRVVISSGIGVSLYQAKQAAIRNCLNSNIKQVSKSKNKELLYSRVNKVARGVVSHVNIIRDFQRPDGLYFVELEATIGQSAKSTKDEKYFSQQRLKHPSIYLDTKALHFYGDHYDKVMMKNRIVFQLEKALQDSYFELKTKEDSDYTLQVDGHFNAFLSECDQQTRALECMSVAMNVYPSMIQKNSSKLLHKSEIAFEKSNISTQLFKSKPSELFIKFIHGKTYDFVDDFVSTQLFKLNNASQIEIKSSIADFALADQLHKLVKDFYGIEEATIKMNPYAELHISSLVDSSFLAQSLHSKLNKLQVKVSSVTRNQIVLESVAQ
ncbi:MAG: hypothetical protein KC646_00685 [Candidatus Cloacimonetes bacterium]|nr:hypothetical protein [Candidatus Cloacimonadota bacterium]